MLLEEQAHVKERLLEHAGLDQHQHDQQPAQAAAMDERLQLRHAVLKVPRRRRHEVRIPRSGAADPVLAASELPRPPERLRSCPAPVSGAACATGLFLPAVEKSSEA